MRIMYCIILCSFSVRCMMIILVSYCFQAHISVGGMAMNNSTGDGNTASSTSTTNTNVNVTAANGTSTSTTNTTNDAQVGMQV